MRKLFSHLVVLDRCSAVLLHLLPEEGAVGPLDSGLHGWVRRCRTIQNLHGELGTIRARPYEKIYVSL